MTELVFTLADREARVDDALDFIAGAVEAIRIATHDGRKHPAGTWREQGYSEHLNHVQQHMFAVLNGSTMDLTNVVLRAVMAWIQRPQEM